MQIRTTRNRNNKIVATLYSKARARTLTGYKFTAKNSEKKYIVPKSQMETKIDSIMNLSIKATLKDLHILTPKTVKTNSND